MLFLVNQKLRHFHENQAGDTVIWRQFANGNFPIKNISKPANFSEIMDIS